MPLCAREARWCRPEAAEQVEEGLDVRARARRVRWQIAGGDMFVQAAIVAKRREDVVVVPRDAITQRGGRNVVFVVDGQRVAQRDVTLGLADDTQFEVSQGLQSGDRIAVRGLETLTDGTRVRVITP